MKRTRDPLRPLADAGLWSRPPADPRQRREVPNGTTISNDRDWTESDRTGRTQRFKDACYANLMALRNTEYTRVIERADFYWWFYNHTAALGCTTRWALAAAIVATGVNEMVDLSPFMEGNGRAIGTMSNERQAFGREGNQVIFDNVFPTALRPWRADLELQMQFLDNNFGNIRGRWVEFEYSDLAPMISS